MIFNWLDLLGVAVLAVSGALAAGHVGLNRLAVAGLSSGAVATAETA